MCTALYSLLVKLLEKDTRRGKVREGDDASKRNRITITIQSKVRISFVRTTRTFHSLRSFRYFFHASRSRCCIRSFRPFMQNIPNSTYTRPVPSINHDDICIKMAATENNNNRTKER